MAEPTLASRLSNLNPFAKRKEDDEDKGEKVDLNSVAGGGHGARQTAITQHELHVSHGLKEFLVEKGILSKEDAGLDSDKNTPVLDALLNLPHIVVPPELTDRSHRLPDYFISSSHNTYLTAHQLFGSSSAGGYEAALNAGARCVEIDAWDNDDDKTEPKVTHGYTLVSHIPFRVVCETIRDIVDKEALESVDEQGYRAAPIFLSLENHCGPEGQLRLAQIMEEVFQHRLLSAAIRQKGHEEQEGGEHITLADLGSKICVIVEHHLANEAEDSDDSDDSEDETEKEARHKYNDQKKETAQSAIIIPELAALGVYAQSVKPADNSWFESTLTNAPHHHLINVSESGLSKLMPASSTKIAAHNASHLMRVYPKGTRISSANLRPVPYWGVGAQIAALNWQTFGAAMQLNEALFAATDGYVLKPAALRAGATGPLSTGRRKKLRLHVAGASNVPVPEGRDAADVKPYVTCTLHHPDDLTDEPAKRKTKGYVQHHLGLVHKHAKGPPTDPVWDEVLEWEFEENELVFLRMLVTDDVKWARNVPVAADAVRLAYVSEGWRFMRMLDLKGRETRCVVLAKFEVLDV